LQVAPLLLRRIQRLFQSLERQTRALEKAPDPPLAKRRLSVSPGVNECMQMRPSAHARRSARRK